MFIHPGELRDFIVSCPSLGPAQLPWGHARAVAKLASTYYPTSIIFYSFGLLLIDLDVKRAPLERISKGCRVLDALVIGSCL